MVVAGFSLSTVLIIRGAQDSLRLALNRLGADIIVVPEGRRDQVETALLMGKPVKVWMPQENLSTRLRVSLVWRRLLRSSIFRHLSNASCCSVSEMFMVAFDPKTDFTIEPWLRQKLGHELRLGESVGGSYVFTPEGEENIKLYGYFVTLDGNLDANRHGAGPDHVLDVRDGARTLPGFPRRAPSTSARDSGQQHFGGAGQGAAGGRRARGGPGHHATGARRDAHRKPAICFRRSANRSRACCEGMLVILSITLVLSLVLISLIFSMAANERRREIGVLRALGATRGFVFLQSILAEAAILAVGGGAVGIALAAWRSLSLETCSCVRSGYRSCFRPCRRWSR